MWGHWVAWVPRGSADPGPLVLDLRIAHELWGSTSDPILNGNLHYPNDIDRSLNETDDDNIRKYRTIITTHRPLSLSCHLFLGRLGDYIVNLYSFYFDKLIGKLTTFLERQEFSLRKETVDYSTSATRCSPRNWAKVGSTLAKTVVLRVKLNLWGEPITSRTHTHPSHSQTSRLLTSSLFLGVPVPRPTHCMWDV